MSTFCEVPFKNAISLNKFNRKISPKVLGGHAAALGDVPHQALLYITPQSDPDRLYLCGASIISTNWLLTTTKCLYGMNNLTAFAGIVDRIGFFEWSDEVDKSQFIIHGSYAKNHHSFDIALVMTTRAIKMSGFVKIVALPTLEENTFTMFRFRNSTISGWGSSGRLPAQFMTTATAYVTLTRMCQIYYGYYVVTNYHLCIQSGIGGFPCGKSV